AIGYARLRRDVREAADPERERLSREKPLAFAPLPPWRDDGVAVAGDETVFGAAPLPEGLLLGGGSGLKLGGRRLDVAAGLRSLRVSAVASWRGQGVFALARGGWGRLFGDHLEEASSAFGPLEVRTFFETRAGELLVGARQGLFRAPFGSGTLERLSAAPVRSLAVLPDGRIAAGGENGLFLVSPSSGGSVTVSTPDPWVESVGASEAGDRLWAATPLGVAFSRVGAPLTLHPRGGDGTAGVFTENGFAFVPVGGGSSVARVFSDGRRTEEPTPERFERLFVAGGVLHGDGPGGLYAREAGGVWRSIAKRSASALPHPHVNALAAQGTRLWLGFFDAGLAASNVGKDGALESVAPVAGSEPWGVNALLSSGDALFAATLRGAFRVEKGRAYPLEGAGGAFSLAATTSGIAVGYGQGVFVPERRLLSAFHGLPGNQAYALASRGTALWVGTPTGLGRVERLKVTARTSPGDGHLPHSWVTALAGEGGALWVGTYGGGIVRRTGEGPNETWERFPETDGLKVNPGTLLVTPAGRIVFGTVGKGLYVSNSERTRFEPMDVPLPSPDVFAAALFPADSPRFLFVG
ncbi:MAG TPA: hypothetical protein VGR00_01235, partial [Thermoanaerobaculia bacterium]|nr:hypothetical protein [Thermoanaerobaculia bacterium]